MELNRLENSRKRLFEKINEGRKYLEKEKYDVNELSRLKNIVQKKKLQFEKDLEEYGKTEDKNQERITELEDFLVEGEDLNDDLEHYIEVLQKRKAEVEEEKRIEKEMEQKRMDLEEKRIRMKQEIQRKRLELERYRRQMEERIQQKRNALTKSNIEMEKQRHEDTLKAETKHHEIELERSILEKETELLLSL